MNEHGHPGYDRPRPQDGEHWVETDDSLTEPSHDQKWAAIDREFESRNTVIDREFEPDAPVVGLCVICWYLHLDTRAVSVTRVAQFVIGGRSVCRTHLMIATVHDVGFPALMADAQREYRQSVTRPPARPF